MGKNLFILLLMAMGIPLNTGVFGQSTWQNWLGGPRQDAALGMERTADDGYLIVGYSHSFGKGEERIKKGEIRDKKSDVLLVKVDSAGTVNWSRTLGTDADEWGTAICPAGANGFLVSGTRETGKDATRQTDYLLAKITDGGDLLWAKAGGGRGDDRIHSLTPTLDGGFLLTGTTSSPIPSGIRGESLIWFARIDGEGKTTWSKTLGGGGEFTGIRTVQQPGGGYVVAGHFHLPYSDFNELLLFRLDDRGNMSWLWRYAASWDLTLFDMQLRPDGGVLLAGNSRRFRDAGVGGPFLIKTDERGTVEWSRTYTGPGWDEGDGLKEVPGGGFLLYGTTRSFTTGISSGFVYQVNEKGGLEWATSYGGKERENIRGAAPRPQGGWLLAGKTETFGEGIHEVYLVATDPEGRAGCLTETCPVEVKPLEGLKKNALLLAPGTANLPEKPAPEIMSVEMPEGQVCRPKRKR